MENVTGAAEGYHSQRAAHYLRAVSHARLHQSIECGDQWTPQWWREREQEALGALAALRQTMKTMEEQADHDH